MACVLLARCRHSKGNGSAQTHENSHTKYYWASALQSHSWRCKGIGDTAMCVNSHAITHWATTLRICCRHCNSCLCVRIPRNLHDNRPQQPWWRLRLRLLMPKWLVHKYVRLTLKLSDWSFARPALQFDCLGLCLCLGLKVRTFYL